MTPTRLIAILVFATWTAAALTVSWLIVFWFLNIDWEGTFDQPIEVQSDGTITTLSDISDSVFTITDLSCALMDRNTVHVTGMITNSSSKRTRSVSLITKLRTIDGTQLSSFRSILTDDTIIPSLAANESVEFEVDGRMVPGAENCQVEVWESGRSIRVYGEPFAIIR